MKQWTILLLRSQQWTIYYLDAINIQRFLGVYKIYSLCGGSKNNMIGSYIFNIFNLIFGIAWEWNKCWCKHVLVDATGREKVNVLYNIFSKCSYRRTLPEKIKEYFIIEHWVRLNSSPSGINCIATGAAI